MADVSSLHTFGTSRYSGYPSAQSRIPALQQMCARLINKKWDDMPQQDIAFLVNGDAPEAVQRLVVKRLAQNRSNGIIQSLLPATGIFGADNSEERLLFLELLAHDIVLLKTQERMRSEVHKWCSNLRSFLEANAEEQLSVEEVAESDMHWRLKQQYLKFPRPQCDSENQIRQILDILDRCRIASYESDETQVGKDSASTLVSTIEVHVRAPSKELRKLIKTLPDGQDHRQDRPIKPKNAFCGKKEGTLSLTYSCAHEMPKYGDPSTRISLLIGTERYWGYKLFNYESSYSGTGLTGEFGPQLRALKSRLLAGAPGLEESQMTDQQFMSLLLMLFLGHKQGGYVHEHYMYFAGYFANDAHADNHYS
eukprot:TRINITY_DN12179_c0_g1_i1.p1 TRINITY_DN12179_c0_g1~~TRINITY_DN12179_c0_g1_i1.p1  ORF type:complete len:389 (-),score=42.88 TRINITY_DN12179_c0_g1_i1:64-1161(-)